MKLNEKDLALIAQRLFGDKSSSPRQSLSQEDFGSFHRDHGYGQSAKEPGELNSIEAAYDRACKLLATDPRLFSQEGYDLGNTDLNPEEAAERERELLRGATAAAVAVNTGSVDTFEDPQQDIPREHSDKDGGTATVVVDSGIYSPESRDVGRQIKVSNEAYDNQDLRKASTINFLYNFHAARQNEFAEAFFEPYQTAPGTAYVELVIDLMYVMNNYKHSVDGSGVYQFGRSSLVDAMVYDGILHDDYTDIVPVYREGRNSNASYFADPNDIQPVERVRDDGTAYKTAPLRTQTTHDLLSLSQTEEILGHGGHDFTDQIDNSVYLSALYLKFANKQIFRYGDLRTLPESCFHYGVTGNANTAVLTFNNRWFTLDKSSTDITGKPLDIPSLRSGYRVQIEIIANGSVSLDTGSMIVNPGLPTVTRIYDQSDRQVKLDSAEGKRVVADFTGVSIPYFEQNSRKTNTNHRERGQNVGVNRERLVYLLPRLSPISSTTPIGDKTWSDADRTDMLIKTTYVRSSRAAVDTILSIENHLAHLPPLARSARTELYHDKMLGAARYFIEPYYRHYKLSVMKEINSLKTSDRLADMQATILNVLRELLYEAYRDSNYQAAAEVIYGQNPPKPTIVIGTEPRIVNYLQLTGDTRTFGPGFETKIVSSPDERIRNRIYATISIRGTDRRNIASPLTFGRFYWAPEFVTQFNMARNGTASDELVVQPKFLYTVNSAILIRVDITDLPDAMMMSQPIKTTNVVV